MNPFSNIPNFPRFSRSTHEERSSRPDIEDVDYQEVKSSRNPTGNDKNALEKQLLDEAFSHAAGLMKKAPLSGIIHSLIWVEGAKWADDHHKSEYTTEHSWLSAGREALHKHLQDMNPEALQDPVLMAILFVSFTLGAKWAESHPANG